MSKFPCHKCSGERVVESKSYLTPAYALCPECKGTGIDPWPWTGFTIELDGDQEAVRRVYRAAQAEMEKILKEQDAEEIPLHFLSPIHSVFRATLWPFHGKLAFRDDRVDLRDWPV